MPDFGRLIGRGASFPGLRGRTGLVTKSTYTHHRFYLIKIQYITGLQDRTGCPNIACEKINNSHVKVNL